MQLGCCLITNYLLVVFVYAGSPDDGDNEAEGLDEGASTCFLCDLTFKNTELTTQHLHHVHMKWVKRTVRPADKEPEVATQVRTL